MKKIFAIICILLFASAGFAENKKQATGEKEIGRFIVVPFEYTSTENYTRLDIFFNEKTENKLVNKKSILKIDTVTGDAWIFENISSSSWQKNQWSSVTGTSAPSGSDKIRKYNPATGKIEPSTTSSAPSESTKVWKYNPATGEIE